jgi:ankyrin repeat protein
MAWDRTVGRALSEAMDDDNLEEFVRLLDAHPEHIRAPDGSNCWMKNAAQSGRVRFLQVILERGVNVNEPSGDQNPDSQFYEPDGPILWAAAEGQLDSVRWLLDHSAKLNFTVRGKIRCLSLMWAAKEGHFEVVKLLIERGADWRSTSNGHTPEWYAKEYGQNEVVEYFQSLQE